MRTPERATNQTRSPHEWRVVPPIEVIDFGTALDQQLNHCREVLAPRAIWQRTTGVAELGAEQAVERARPVATIELAAACPLIRVDWEIDFEANCREHI